MQKEKNLLRKFLQGKASQKEKRAVESWLDASAKENNEWQQLNNEEKTDLLTDLWSDVKFSIASEKAKRKKRAIKYIGRGAAAVLLLLMIPLYYQWNMPSPDQPIEVLSKRIMVKAATGEIKEVVLADGSKVWLNAESELSYNDNFKGKTRDVYLSGQAFFDVAHDAKKPFVVHARSLTIKVLGTSFDVSDYKEDKKAAVAVLSGKVALQEVQNADITAVLNRGEMASFDKMKSTLTKGTFEATVIPSWIKKEVVFYHTTMGQVANYLHRNYNLNVRFSGKQIENLEVSGDFGKIDNMENLLSMICLTINAEYKISGREVVIKLID